MRLEGTSPPRQDVAATSLPDEDERQRRRQQTMLNVLQCLNEALEIADEVDLAVTKSKSNSGAGSDTAGADRKQ